jgi:HEAT repeat protein
MNQLASLLLVASSVLICLQSTLPAQQSREPLERLRAIAHKRIQQMEVQFDARLLEAARILSRVAPEEDSALYREARKDLLPWVAVFPEKFLGAIRASNQERSRQNFIRIMAAEGSVPSAEALLSLLPGKDDAFVLRAVGGMTDPGAKARNVIFGLLSNETPAFAPVRAEALIALARMKDPRVVEFARGILQKPAAEPLGAAAAEALAEVSSNAKADGDLLRTVARDSARPLSERAAALRSLAKFGGGLDNLRALHDSLEDHIDLVHAALDSLATVGDKNTSKNYLLKLTRDHASEEIRVRAATVLSDLGVYDGARALTKDLQAVAEERGKDTDAHRAVADRYYQLHAWPLALDWYEKAFTLSRFSGKAEIKVWAARCRARLGQFDKARANLKEGGYDHFAQFAEDPAFDRMRMDPRYEPLFRTP